MCAFNPIVRDLNDEKIDVIEWNPESAAFISKALSPARVSGVFLDEDVERGKTAAVVVPEDQLSLAIGRAGVKRTPGGTPDKLADRHQEPGRGGNRVAEPFGH